MSYGQQPQGGQSPQQPDGAAPPPPPAPGGQPGYGTPAPGGYGAPDQQQPWGAQQPAPGGFGDATAAYGGQPSPQGGPWAAPGVPTKRPGQVTAGAVMSIVGGAFALLAGIILAAAGSSPEITREMGMGSEAGSFFAAIGGVLAVIGALVIVFAVFVLRGKMWAAIGLGVLAALYVVLGILGTVNGEATGIVGIVYVAAATALCLTPQARAWYRAKA